MSLQEEYQEYRRAVEVWLYTNPNWYIQEHPDGRICAHSDLDPRVRELRFTAQMKLEEISDIHDDMTIADVEKRLRKHGFPRLTIRLGKTITAAAEGDAFRIEGEGPTLGQALNDLCLAFERGHRPARPTTLAGRIRAQYDPLTYEERHARILRTYSPEAIPEACAALDKEFGR